MNKAQSEYLTNHRDLHVDVLAKSTGVSKRTIQKFLANLPPVEPVEIVSPALVPTLAPKQHTMSDVMARPVNEEGKPLGAVVATKAASEMSDELLKKRTTKNRYLENVHRPKGV